MSVERESVEAWELAVFCPDAMEVVKLSQSKSCVNLCGSLNDPQILALASFERVLHNQSVPP
jgi:hypothetical protein